MLDDVNEPVEVTPEALIKQLADLTALMTEVRSEVTKVKEKRHEIREAIREDREATAKINYELQQQIQRNTQELNERVAVIAANDTPLGEAEFDLQRKLREAERTAESLQRQIDQARRAELAAAEWATLEARWDKETMGAPWREWAKDHQLQGARKITYEGRMILGDTMGLGKTLTSLIALDMIQVATKEASPDNPIEFGSMK